MADTPDTKWARDVSFPFQFLDDCDLVQDENEEVVDQALILITFTRNGVVLLTSNFGSALTSSVFDQLDDVTELEIDSTLRRAFETQEPRVFLDREFIFDETAGANKLIVLVPYRIVVTGKYTVARLVIPRQITG